MHITAVRTAVFLRLQISTAGRADKKYEVLLYVHTYVRSSGTQLCAKMASAEDPAYVPYGTWWWSAHSTEPTSGTADSCRTSYLCCKAVPHEVST